MIKISSMKLVSFNGYFKYGKKIRGSGSQIRGEIRRKISSRRVPDFGRWFNAGIGGCEEGVG